MLKRFKFARFTLYALIIIFATTHIILSHRFSSPTMKQNVQAQLSNLLGNQVKIKSIRLSGILHPKIVASDVQILNPNDDQYGNAPYLAQLKQVELKANMHSLLHHALIIKNITLEQGTVYLITDGQQQNWSPLLDHIQKNYHATAHPLFPIKMKKINLHLINLDHSSQYTFYHLNFDFIPQQHGGNIQLALNTQLSSNQANKKIPLNFTLQLHHNKQQLQFKSGHLTLGNLQAQLSPVKKPSTKKLQSVISTDQFDLTQLASSLSFSLPGNVNAWHKVMASANLIVSRSGIQFKNASLKVNDNLLKGKLRYQLNPRASLDFQLHAKTIDINDFLMGPGQSDRANTPQQPPQFNRFPFALRGNLKIENLLLNGLDLTPVSMHIASNEQTLKLDPIRFMLQQGHGFIKANITPENNQLQISSYVNLKKMPIGLLLKRFTKAANFKGTLDLISDYETTGSDFKSWISNLSGKGQIEISDGTIKGIDIPYVLHSASSLFHMTPKIINQHETQFNTISGEYQIQHGVVSNRQLALQVGQHLLQANGTINLNNNQLNFSLVTKNNQAQNQFLIPLKLIGTIENPVLNLDDPVIKKELIHPINAFKKVKNNQKSFFQRVKALI